MGSEFPRVSVKVHPTSRRPDVRIGPENEGDMTSFKAVATATLIALAAIGATSGPAAADTIETIDCRVDRNRAERTICASQHLQILDAKITEVYADAMKSRRVSSHMKEDLRRSQYAFLSRRDACGADYICLNEVMTLRLGRIRNHD